MADNLTMPQRFYGDGRRMLKAMPSDIYPGTRPIKITRAVCAQLTKSFDSYGKTHHSARGESMWVILEHCREMNIGHYIYGEPGKGFVISRDKLEQGEI